MAALESLNFDSETAVHYIHCILSNVPLGLAVAEVAPMIVPSPECDVVGRLQAVGCRIVPHRLHMFKEALDTKFGFVTFFAHQTSSLARPELVHELILEWVQQDLRRQLASLRVSVSLGHPSECYSSVPFLRALHADCSLLNPSDVEDTKKLETFLLSKIHFFNSVGDLEKGSLDGRDKAGVSKVVGSFRLSSLSARELMWLVRQHRRLPRMLVTNGNLASATCNQEALHDFLRGSLLPLFEVLP